MGGVTACRTSTISSVDDSSAHKSHQQPGHCHFLWLTGACISLGCANSSCSAWVDGSFSFVIVHGIGWLGLLTKQGF